MSFSKRFTATASALTLAAGLAGPALAAPDHPGYFDPGHDYGNADRELGGSILDKNDGILTDPYRIARSDKFNGDCRNSTIAVAESTTTAAELRQIEDYLRKHGYQEFEVEVGEQDWQGWKKFNTCAAGGSSGSNSPDPQNPDGTPCECTQEDPGTGSGPTEPGREDVGSIELPLRGTPYMMVLPKGPTRFA